MRTLNEMQAPFDCQVEALEVDVGATAQEGCLLCRVKKA